MGLGGSKRSQPLSCRDEKAVMRNFVKYTLHSTPSVWLRPDKHTPLANGVSATPRRSAFYIKNAAAVSQPAAKGEKGPAWELFHTWPM